MFKAKASKQGFTLIELLAVIIILGVLLLIAVPTVSKYIEDSRKNAYINSVKAIVESISTKVNNLEYPVPKGEQGIIVPFSEAELKNGVSKMKSPYAPYVEGRNYVVVTFYEGTYNYYVACLDESGFAIPMINYKELDVNDITTNYNVINQNIHSIEEIERGGILETMQFSISHIEKIEDINKVKIDYNIEYCTIFYDSSEGTIKPLDSKTFICGSYFKLAIPEVVIDGYEFLGWSSNKGAETVQFPGGREIATNSSQVLYPVLKETSS